MARSALLNVMVQAALKAGKSLGRDFGEVQNLQVSVKGPGDFVSAADRKAEKIVREELLKARPTYGFLGEESEEIKGTDGAHRWIVDPLDGTTNFLRGIPHFAVSIACKYRGRLEHAVIVDPVRQEEFTASRGRGAQLNGRRLRVSSRTSLEGALLGTGFPFRDNQMADMDNYLGMFRALTGQTAGIRRAGSASLDLAYVAAGRFDA
ncbi:inositol monophosphatase family protein, partial [Rhizobium phaseoli]